MRLSKCIGFFLVGMPSLLFATGDCTVNGIRMGGMIFGHTHCSSKSVDNMNVHGFFSGNDFTILGDFTVDGGAKLSQSRVNSVTVNGTLTADWLSVRKGATIHGLVNLSNSQLSGDFDVHGDLVTSKDTFASRVLIDGSLNTVSSVFSGAVNVHGSVNCKQSIFSDDFVIDSSQLVFNTCQAKGVEINNTSDSQSKTVVRLNGSSVLRGDLKFVGKPGLVYLNKKSMITGQVINGKIIKTT